MINRQWKIYGKAVNMLLKSINTQNKIINEDSIIKNCDLNNQSEVAVVINMIKNKSTDINDLETKLAKLFKNNNITVQMYKDGGTYHVKVGNNMKILLSNGDYRKRGHIVFAVKKGENIEKNEYMPNGEKYKYNDDTSRKYYDEYFGYGW